MDKKERQRSKLAGTYLPWPNHLGLDRVKWQIIAMGCWSSKTLFKVKACDSLYLHLFQEPKDPDVVAFNLHFLAFLSTISSQFDCWNKPRVSEQCIMGYSISSQGLPVLKSEYGSSRFWHVRIRNSTREFGFFYTIRGLPQAGKYSDVICRGV